MSTTEPCSEGCPGWGVFSTGWGTLELQRCDECGTFSSDTAAAASALLAVASDEPQPFPKEEICLAIIGDLMMALGSTRAEIETFQDNHEGGAA